MVKATQVFTPTDVPTVTYVERTTKNYEEDLRRAFDIPKMIVSISGPSKSGKNRSCHQSNIQRQPDPSLWCEHQDGR